MKKNILIGGFVLIVLILFGFLYGKFGKLGQTNKDTNQSGENNTISTGILETDLPKSEIEKEKKLPKEDVPALKPYDKLVKSEGVKKSMTIYEKLENAGSIRDLDIYLQALCGKKTNIDDITCSAQFSYFEPRLFSFLLRTKKNLSLSFDDIMNFLISGIQRNCSQVKGQDLELLIRAFKENDTTCTKEVTNIYNQKYKELSNLFKTFQLTEKTFPKPFSIYYNISNDLTDVKQRNLQILILENINKQAKEKYGSIENFKEKILSYNNAETEENLKQLILKSYEELFKKYNLSQCGLKLDGYENYFVWIPIEKKAVKCFKEKILDKGFETDYNKFMEKLAAYTYISKNFLGEKATAKVLFGPEGVGITNILDINAILSGN